jgi:hypothetical protein
LLASTGAIALSASPSAAADKTDLAISALEFGGSMAKLTWVAVKPLPGSELPPDKYVALAQGVQHQIELARASSAVLTSTMNAIGAASLYTAVADPEPLSKAVAGLAAWGAKKTGDGLGDLIREQTEAQVQSIIARGLHDSRLTRAELSSMTPQQLENRVADLRIGTQKISEILKDDPKSLDLLKATALDTATDIGVAGLAQSKVNADDIATIKKNLNGVRNQIDDYANKVEKRLDLVTNALDKVQTQAEVTSEKVKYLSEMVQGNTAAINSLSEISYEGWSTSQKLYAVKSGLLPGLGASERIALIDSLQAQQRQEHLVANLQSSTKDLSEIAAIAGQLGASANIVNGITTAQKASATVLQFATGNYLAAASSAMSLIGLGGGDGQSAMMSYLKQEFDKINAKLDKILELQAATLQSLQSLAESERNFHKDVFAQLDRIENSVINSRTISQAVLVSQWQTCRSYIDNPHGLNGQPTFLNFGMLAGTINTPGMDTWTGTCYNQMSTWLGSNVLSTQWAGTVISARAFPTTTIVGDPALLKQWQAYANQRIASYDAITSFMQAYFSARPTISSIEKLARLMQPVGTASEGQHLEAELSAPIVQAQLKAFTCDQHDIIRESLRTLMCFRKSANAPDASRYTDLVKAELIGPQAYGIIDTGVSLAQFSNFAVLRNGSFLLPSVAEIQAISASGMSQKLQEAVSEKKGDRLLEQLSWLTDLMVLQQSILSGNLSAELIEQTLYNSSKRAIDPQSADQTLAPLALEAMKLNPTLARNVVLLGFRHAIADSLGGDAKAARVLYLQMKYAYGLKDLQGSKGCASPAAGTVLTKLLPNWSFQYRASSATKAADPKLSICPDAAPSAPRADGVTYPTMGEGNAVAISDFYVTLPSPLSLSSGRFERSEGLDNALRSRDRVAQAEIDLNISATLGSSTPQEIKSKKLLAFNLINEGWGWTPPTKVKFAAHQSTKLH